MDDSGPNRAKSAATRSPCAPAQFADSGGAKTGLLAIAIMMAILSSGCYTSPAQWVRNHFKVGPQYVEPPTSTAPGWIDGADPHIKSDPALDCAWWTAFQDPQLDSLIQSAYRQNLDLKTAGARILEARGQRGIAIGNLFPQQQTANFNYIHAQVSKNIGLNFPPHYELWTNGLNATWEADVWGRFRRSIEASNANLAAAEESYGEVLVMLLADVAESYIQLRTYQLRIEYARQNVEIQRGSLGLAEARFRLGATNELDVVQARAQLEQTESQIPLLEMGARRASNSLCVLFGMPPSDSALWLQPAPLPQAPKEISLGMPADLVRRRPDVRNYERQVAAASAQIGIAEADLYPTLGVNGYIGYFATDITQLYEPRSFTGIISPTVQWNVLNYGRIANNIAVQDARLQEAALSYEQSVLRAAREVEDALIGYVKTQEQAEKLEKSAADAARSVQLVTRQFELGAADFNRVFTAQRFLVEQQDQLAQARGSIALNLIAVYEAIGGGWLCFRDDGFKPCIGPVDAANSCTAALARRNKAISESQNGEIIRRAEIPPVRR